MTTIKRPKKKVPEEPTFDPNKEKDGEKTQQIIDSKQTPKNKAGKISKVVSLHLSVGDEDRNRTVEEMIEAIMKCLKPVPYGKQGLHATEMGSYYILDGAVCLPRDYDPKIQQFMDGHFPPAWAGGPVTHAKPPQLDISGGKYDRPSLSAKEYDEKYRGKGNPNVRRPVNDDDLEEIDWDESTIGDEKEAKKVASKSITNAKRILRTKKVSPPPPKRTIKRSK